MWIRNKDTILFWLQVENTNRKTGHSQKRKPNTHTRPKTKGRTPPRGGLRPQGLASSNTAQTGSNPTPAHPATKHHQTNTADQHHHHRHTAAKHRHKKTTTTTPTGALETRD